MMGRDEPNGVGGTKRRIRRRPSHATVVAYLALFAALSGGSFALAALSAHDKKVVKRIANGQISKRAPKLSVKHAKRADSATNASHATNADSATTANNAAHAMNADQLGGVPPSAFVSGQGTLRSNRLLLGPSSPATEFLELGFGHIAGVCDAGVSGKIRFVADLPVDNLIVWTTNSGGTTDIQTSNALTAGTFYEEPHTGGLPQSVTVQVTYNDGTHEQVATAWTTVQTAGGQCVFTGQGITTL